MEFLSNDCPTAWLDQEVDPGHVEEIKNILKKSPTTAKAYQPVLACKADICKEDVKSKHVIKGYQIIAIGVYHRQATYTKIMC